MTGLEELRGVVQWMTDHGFEGDRKIWRTMMGHVAQAKSYLEMLDVPQLLTLKQAETANIVWMLKRGQDCAEPRRVVRLNGSTLLMVCMGRMELDIMQAREYRCTWVCFDKEPRPEQIEGMRWETAEISDAEPAQAEAH